MLFSIVLLSMVDGAGNVMCWTSPLSVLVRVWVAIAFSCPFFLFMNYCLFWLSPFRS